MADAPRHVGFAHEHGLEQVSFLWSDPREGRQAPELTADQAAHLDDAAQLAAKLGVRTNLAALQRSHAPDPRPVTGRCALPWLRAYVDLNGNAGPCVDLVIKGRAEAQAPLSNAFTDEVPFAGESFRHARAAFRRGEEPHPVCAGCARCRIPSLALGRSGSKAVRAASPEDRRFDSLDWSTTFVDGLRRAEAEDQPLLLWAMNGHPLGCT